VAPTLLKGAAQILGRNAMNQSSFAAIVLSSATQGAGSF
jgi:hypothetical protein